jgi:hypothetical protein
VPGPIDAETASYVMSLLNECKRQLHILEDKKSDDYRSCQRSLRQAIRELESLLPHTKEMNPPSL